jgi:hypothetical protein
VREEERRERWAGGISWAVRRMVRRVVKWAKEKRRKKKRGRGGKVGRGWAKSREREGEKRDWVFFFF